MKIVGHTITVYVLILLLVLKSLIYNSYTMNTIILFFFYFLICHVLLIKGNLDQLLLFKIGQFGFFKLIKLRSFKII